MVADDLTRCKSDFFVPTFGMSSAAIIAIVVLAVLVYVALLFVLLLPKKDKQNQKQIKINDTIPLPETVKENVEKADALLTASVKA